MDQGDVLAFQSMVDVGTALADKIKQALLH